jgi:hypothetical protein
MRQLLKSMNQICFINLNQKTINVQVKNRDIYQISKRFTGGKPIGHARKLLGLLNKQPKNINNTLAIAASIKNKENTGQIPLPERMLKSLDNPIYQKEIGYLIFALNEIRFLYFPYWKAEKSLHYFKETTKNNIICSSVSDTYTSTSSNKLPVKKLNEIEQLLVKQSFGFLFDNTLPGTPIVRLIILQRAGITPKVARGNIHEIFLEYAENANNKDLIAAGSKISIENISGGADPNFMTELLVAHSHVFFIQKHISTTLVKNYTLLHSTIKGSEEEKNSFYYTGQKNCDVTLVFSNNKVLYLDIKQKEIGPVDFTYNYIKVIYNLENGYEDKEGLDTYLTGINKTIEGFCGDIVDEEDNQDLYKLQDIISKSTTQLEKVIAIHKFVLINFERPYARLSVMIINDINIAKNHQENMEVISAEDVREFKRDTFAPNNMKVYQENLTTFQETKSYRNLKERIIKQGYDTMDSWNISNTQNIIDSIE